LTAEAASLIEDNAVSAIIFLVSLELRLMIEVARISLGLLRDHENRVRLCLLRGPTLALGF